MTCNTTFSRERPVQPSQCVCVPGPFPHIPSDPSFTFSLHFNHRIYHIVVRLHPRTVEKVEKLYEEAIGTGSDKYEECIIEAVNSCISDFNFDKSNYGLVVPKRNGSFALIQKHRSLLRVTTPTWVTLVNLREITLDRIDDAVWRMGTYHGQRVQVYVATKNASIVCLDRMMTMHLVIADMDLTYKVLGHVVDDSGTVVGLMTEDRKGRPYEYRDRTLVYDATSRLLQRNIVHPLMMDPAYIYVDRGKIRIVNIEDLWPLRSDNDPWSELSSSFDELKDRHVPWTEFSPSSAYILSCIPSPEKVIHLIMPSSTAVKTVDRKRKEGGKSQARIYSARARHELSRASRIKPYEAFQPIRIHVEVEETTLPSNENARIEEITENEDDPFAIPDKWGDEHLLEPFVLDV